MIRRRPLDWGWALGVPLAALGAWGAGTVVIWMFTGAAWQEIAGLASLTVIFGGLGMLWLITAYRNNRYTIQRNRLAAALPDEPWRWRPEWEAMRIVHSSRRWGKTVPEDDKPY